MSKVDDSLKDIKYLLGNMGMDIFFAIDNGAKDYETIKIFSGLPMACVKGRLPVLLDLLLVVKKDDGYFLTNKGLNFKAQIENNP